MTHDEAFLQAILEAPDDDTPRLIYADWLEEQDDPRGEFIRVQCQLARLAPDDPARPALEERERRLYAEVSPGWPGSPRDRAAAFAFCRRALVAGTIPVQWYLERADFFRLAPCPGLRIDLTGHQTPPHVVEFVPESVARENVVLPLAVDEGRLTLAMRDAGDRGRIDLLELIHNRPIEAVTAPADQIAAAIERHYGPADTQEVVVTHYFLGYDGGSSGHQ
jgi:uncharacterized protein (TIGR02996 family)